MPVRERAISEMFIPKRGSLLLYNARLPLLKLISDDVRNDTSLLRNQESGLLFGPHGNEHYII